MLEAAGERPLVKPVSGPLQARGALAAARGAPLDQTRGAAVGRASGPLLASACRPDHPDTGDAGTDALRRPRRARARALLARAAPPPGEEARVREAVAADLPGTEPSLARVAQRLGTSPRTLQRRLAAAGTSFAAAVDEVRRERARGYLAARDVSMAEVSWLLGFAEQSAFARAFRRWTGKTPTRWRQAQGEGPGRRPAR